MVIRPKSIATVVVVLRSTPETSSTPTLRSVRCSSVRSGRISLTAPTMLVLPTPNPPATRIFTASGMAAPRLGSERLESIQHFLQKPFIGKTIVRLGPSDGDQPVLEQVTEQHPDNAEGKLHFGRNLGHRERPDAHFEDREVLGTRSGGRERRRRGRHDDRDQLQALP